MTVPIYPRSPNSRMYGYALGAIWNTGIWLPDPDWGLQQDPDVWEKVQRDPVIAHAILQRLHSVSSIDPSVHPGGNKPQDKRAADLVEEALNEIDGWPESRFQAAKAVLLGRSYQFVGGERRRLTLCGVEGDWWVPTGFENIDKRRIQFVPVRVTNPTTGDVTYSTCVQMHRKYDSQWVDLDDEALRRFVVVTYDNEESRLGSGRGILGAIYFYHYAKGVLLREGLAGVERWARGLVAATIKGDRLASTGKTNAEQRQAWLDTISTMSGQGGLVMEEGDTIQVHYPNGEGANATRALIEYLDRGVTQLILGSVLPTGGGADVGSNARARVEADSSQVLIQHDRRIMDDAYSRTIMDCFWRHNRALLGRAGVLTAKHPKLRSVQESREDPSEFAAMAKTVLDSGVPIKRAQYYERVGLEMPVEGEDVIEGRAAPDPMAGGFGMGGGGFGGGGAGPGGSSVTLPGEEPSLIDKVRTRIAENSGGTSDAAA